MLQFSTLQLKGFEHGITERGDSVPSDVIMGEQIHKDVTTWIESDSPLRIKKADALLTKKAGLTLGVRTADCVPLLFIEPRRGIVGTIHAGWRGTALEIARKAIDALGFAPHHVRVGLGPAICAKCFVVGEEVASQFDRSVVEQNGDQWTVDLWQANVDQLKDAGVPARNIEVMRICTLEDDRFFSFRGGDRLDRNIAYIRKK